MCGGVRGWVGGGIWFPHGNCVCGMCVRVVRVKDRVVDLHFLLHGMAGALVGVGVWGSLGA